MPHLDVVALRIGDAEGGTWSLIDQTGTEVRANLTWGDAREASEGLIAAQDAATGLRGFFDTAGEAVVPAAYRACLPFSGGRAPAQEDASGLRGLIDAGGAWAVAPAFEMLGEAQSALFAARDVQSRLCGYIDADGSWAIGADFHDVGFPSET